VDIRRGEIVNTELTCIPFGLFVGMLANGGASEHELRDACPNLGPRVQVRLAYARDIPSEVPPPDEPDEPESLIQA
jgi:hypothetical protein